MKNNLIFIFTLCFLAASIYSCRSKETLLYYKKGTNHSNMGLPAAFLIKTNNVTPLKDTVVKLNFIDEYVQMKRFEVKAIFWDMIGEYHTEKQSFINIDTIFCLKEMSLDRYKKIIKYVLENDNKQLIKSDKKMLLRIVSKEDNPIIYYCLDNNLICFGYYWIPDRGVLSFRYLGFEVNMGGNIRFNAYDGTNMVNGLRDATDEEAIEWLNNELERTSW